MGKVLDFILGVVIFLLLIVVSTFIEGYVLTIMWSWFAVSIFGLPALGLAQAMGISLLITFLTHQFDKNQWKTEEDESWMVKCGWGLLHIFVRPFVFLLVGAVVHSFM